MAIISFYVYNYTWQYISTSINGILVSIVIRKQSGMMAFLDHNKCHRRLIIRLQRSTSLQNRELQELENNFY